MKGSVTIEASFIYPMIIIFTVLIILYGFHCHDRLAIKSFTYKSLITSNYDSDTNPDTSAIQAGLKDICLLSGSYYVSYNQNKQYISVTDKNGNLLKIPFSGYERCDFIRKYYTILNIMK